MEILQACVSLEDIYLGPSIYSRIIEWVSLCVLICFKQNSWASGELFKVYSLRSSAIVLLAYQPFSKWRWNGKWWWVKENTTYIWKLWCGLCDHSCYGCVHMQYVYIYFILIVDFFNLIVDSNYMKN